MVITHNITLDVARHGIQAVIPVTQHDANSHRIIIKLKNGGVPITFEEDDRAVAYLNWGKDDSYETVVRSKNDPISPNTLVLNLTPNATSVTGEVDVTIQVYSSTNSENIYSAPTFTLCVAQDTTSGSNVATSTPYGDILRIKAEMESYANDVKDVAEAIKDIKKYNGEYEEVSE